MKLLAILLLSLGSAFAQGDLSGKWDVTASPEGRAPIKLDAVLKHESGELTGTVNSALGSGPVKNAVVGNPEIAFQFLIGKYVFEVKAVVEGTEIKGTFVGPRNMKGPFVAKRADLIQAVEGVEVAEMNGASYRIDIPANFNGTLIVYCHGYNPNPVKFDKEKPANALTKEYLASGFAVAQSGYSKGGWAVKEALEETEALRKHFAGKYGKPKRTIITGHSMGGFLTVATAELYPQHYDAALQLCGPTGPALSLLKTRVFDTLVVYDAFFPGVLGPLAEKADEGAVFDLKDRVQKQLSAFPERGMAFQRWGLFQSDAEIGSVVSFYYAIQQELIQRAGGNPFDNRSTIYQGTPDDIDLNRTAKRYAAVPAAAEYIRKNYSPTGALKMPMISLHTTYDPLVPALHANEYGNMVQVAGTSDLYLQRFVARAGHCTFTPKETIAAMQDLLTWKESGKRPESGEQK